MLKNYIRTAFRNLWRRKGFSLLNILGLTIGMAAAFLIFLYVRFELSYDSFHKKADRIYRIVTDLKTPTEVQHFNRPAWAVPPHMVGELPEAASAVRIVQGDNWMISRGDNHFEEDDVCFTDSAFFQVFDFPLIKGDPKTALKEPFSVVLTESMAKKFFGNENPMGQSLTLTRDRFNATVKGVMKDVPENSQIKASVLVSMNTFTRRLSPGLDDDWNGYGANAYVLLKPGASAAGLQAKLPAFLEKMNGSEMHRNQRIPVLLLEPLRDVYLYSTRDGSASPGIRNVYIFSIVGVFILLIACINFVNLTTARSVERAKEVGIRKVLGSGRGQLVRQFIGESVLLCLMALLLAILAAALLLPSFNRLAGKAVSPGILSEGFNLLVLLGVALLIGIVAALYPAFVLSSFQPVEVLKGRFSSGSRGLFLRRALVVVQFTIATALIIGTLVVYQQLNFMRNEDLGMNMNRKILLDTRGDSARFAFKQAVAMLPGVESTAMTAMVPGGFIPPIYIRVQNVHGDMQQLSMDMNIVDYDFLSQFKIKVLAGRPFSRDFGSDTSQAMILNETAVKLLGYRSPDQIIGKKFGQWGGDGAIIGVVKDFHYKSLRESIKPLFLRVHPDWCDNLSVYIDGRHVPATLAGIERLWKKMLPDKPYSYFFLDEFFNRQYRSENQFGSLFMNFAVLAILISCLGLMGLASYSTLQRTKEIGVRKVIGASSGSIVLLLCKDFLRLVVWSFLIAAPLSWFFAEGWLKGFAYRISGYWWIFAVAGFTAFCVALFTICFQAIRAALTNPVISLRSE